MQISVLLAEGFEDEGVDQLGDQGLAFGGGVDGVALVEAGVSGDAVEKEGDERELIALSQAGIEGGKGFGVFRSHIGGCLHSGEDDADVRSGLTGSVDDALKVDFDLCDFQPTEGVIGTESDDQQVGGSPQHPVDPAHASGRGVAAQTGVDHVDGIPGGTQLFLNQGGKGFIRGQSVSSGQAVPEKDDADRIAGCGAIRTCQQEQSEKTEKNEGCPQGAG